MAPRWKYEWVPRTETEREKLRPSQPIVIQKCAQGELTNTGGPSRQPQIASPGNPLLLITLRHWNYEMTFPRCFNCPNALSMLKESHEH